MKDAAGYARPYMIIESKVNDAIPFPSAFTAAYIRSPLDEVSYICEDSPHSNEFRPKLDPGYGFMRWELYYQALDVTGQHNASACHKMDRRCQNDLAWMIPDSIYESLYYWDQRSPEKTDPDHTYRVHDST